MHESEQYVQQEISKETGKVLLFKDICNTATVAIGKGDPGII